MANRPEDAAKPVLSDAQLHKLRQLCRSPFSASPCDRTLVALRKRGLAMSEAIPERLLVVLWQATDAGRAAVP